MGADSRIEWTHHTHNPWIGCAAVSPACDHCYAEKLGKRFGVAWGPREPRRRTSEAYRAQPYRWDRAAAKAGERHRVFSASLADIWDNAVPIAWLADELDIIRQTTSLDWLLLTKRPQLILLRLVRALEFAIAAGNRPLRDWLDQWSNGQPPHNVWLGTTTENRAEMLRRGTLLAGTPAARRFWSAEPLLGPLGEIPAEILPDWIIAGGESGAGARAPHPAWFREIRDQCQAAAVPFFFKQWGEWAPADPMDTDAPWPNGWRALAAYPHVPRGEELTPEAGAVFVARYGKKAAGAELDRREWKEFPA